MQSAQDQDYIPEPAPAQQQQSPPQQQLPDLPPLPPTAVPVTQSTMQALPPVAAPTSPPPGMTTTQIVIAVAIMVALAGAFLFLRSGVKNALISGKSTLDAANFAATLWYVFLLLLSGMIVIGVFGGFFSIAAYAIVSGGLALVGLVICLIITANARRTRK